MAHELRLDRKLARHRGALLAGLEAAPSVASGDPREQVGPRTSRPSRGMQIRLHQRDGRRRIPRAGFRHFSLRSPERETGRSAR